MTTVFYACHCGHIEARLAFEPAPEMCEFCGAPEPRRFTDIDAIDELLLEPRAASPGLRPAPRPLTRPMAEETA